MPLDSALLAAPVQPALARLSPKTWHAELVAAAALKRAKSAADKAAREAEGLWKAAQAKIRFAIGDAPGAICGSIIVTLKTTAPSPATLTLADGTVIPWSSVVSVLVGNRTVPARDVAKLYGGREPSPSVDIVGC